MDVIPKTLYSLKYRQVHICAIRVGKCKRFQNYDKIIG